MRKTIPVSGYTFYKTKRRRHSLQYLMPNAKLVRATHLTCSKTKYISKLTSVLCLIATWSWSWWKMKPLLQHAYFPAGQKCSGPAQCVEVQHDKSMTCVCVCVFNVIQMPSRSRALHLAENQVILFQNAKNNDLWSFIYFFFIPPFSSLYPSISTSLGMF